MNYTLGQDQAQSVIWEVYQDMDSMSPYLVVAKAAFYSLYGDKGIDDLKNTKDEDAWYDSRNALAALRYWARQRVGNVYLPSQYQA